MSGVQGEEALAPAPVVVAVHLGPSRPRWLAPMLRSLVRDGYVPVVATDNARVASGLREICRVHQIEPRPVAADSFRQGFWSLSTERFVALAEVHEVLGADIVHVESDVRLAPGIDFSELRRRRQAIAFPMLAPGRGSGSVVYLRDPEASRQLATELSAFVRATNGNDMQGLWDFWQRHPRDVGILPCVVEADDRRLKDSVGPQAYAEMHSLRAAMSGVFDAASYGQFLFGTDGRNDRYGRRVIGGLSLSHFSQPSGLSFKRPLEWPITLSDGSRLLSLHVHSKDVQALGRQDPSTLVSASVDHVVRRVDLWALGSNIRGAMERKARRVRARLR